MKKYFFFLFILMATGCRPSPPPDSAAMAQTILQTFEREIQQLSPAKQGHFCQRLYRITGDPRYLPALKAYGRHLTETFHAHLANLDSAEYRKKETEKLLQTDPETPAKVRWRIRSQKKFGELVFANRLLFQAFQIKSMGLDQGALAKDFSKAIAYFRSLPLKDYLLDPQVIRYDGSHTTNAIFYLKYLGLGDYEEAYAQQFRKVFFVTSDQMLDGVTYRNKIYGLTHFIIAASNFYQNRVDSKKYNWILDYFSKNFGEIANRTTPDIVAELAVCFQLAGKSSHPLVRSVRRSLASSFDPQRGLIPFAGPAKSMEALEHRNILAAMALMDFKQLYPGPVFIQLEETA